MNLLLIGEKAGMREVVTNFLNTYESGGERAAVQTLREVQERLVVAKRLECVRLQRRFRSATISTKSRQAAGHRKNYLLPAKSAARRPAPISTSSRIRRIHTTMEVLYLMCGVCSMICL
jgi:hypothetical protein